MREWKARRKINQLEEIGLSTFFEHLFVIIQFKKKSTPIVLIAASLPTDGRKYAKLRAIKRARLYF